MKKYFFLCLTLITISCGIIEDTKEETLVYTYILKNSTGEDLSVTSDFERTELITNGNSFRCETVSSVGYIGGLCSGKLEIRLSNQIIGFRCLGSPLIPEGLCFVEDDRVFTISEGSIFTEIDTRVYEYVLTPELLEGAFELPE